MKYLTKEVKLAVTAVVAIVLLFILINFLKGINIFTSSNTYHVRFKDIAGLVVSNPVYANGYAVGIVRDIQYDYKRTDNVVVTIEVDKEMKIPEGTCAELESELMGGVKMNLILGPNPVRNLSVGDTIAGGIHFGAMERVSAMLPAVEQMMPKLDSILANLNRLTADPALAQTLHNTAELTANLQEASVALNAMMRNDMPQLMRKANNIGTNMETLSGNLARVDIEGTVGQVNTTLGSVQQLTDDLSITTTLLNNKLNSRNNTLGLFLNDRGVYDNLNSTMRHADSLMIDLKAHPKRYVHFSIFGRKDK